jgi:hypothetical protein
MSPLQLEIITMAVSGVTRMKDRYLEPVSYGYALKTKKNRCGRLYRGLGLQSQGKLEKIIL